jgi:hypothetical protein
VTAPAIDYPSGAAPPEVRIRFGDLPNQTMPREWAESMLRGWRERDPEGFGYALAETATGVAPKAPSKRSRSHAEQNGAG